MRVLTEFMHQYNNEDNKSSLFSIDQDIDYIISATNPHRVPEISMWCQLMFDALEEIGVRKQNSAQRRISFRLWKQTRDWILSKDIEAFHVGSFDWVCQEVNIDSVKLRKMILNYYCDCCSSRVIQFPCKNIVKKIPSYAHKVCVDPKLWKP